MAALKKTRRPAPNFLPSFKKALEDRLKDAERIALLGVGSEFRGDDIAGILVARKLDEACRPLVESGKFRVFIGGTAPENFTGEIKKFNPDHLLIVDSAALGKKPGTVKLINPDEIGGFSFSTHRLPLKMLSEYLFQSLPCQITLIGIQPGTLEFGSRLSKEVEKSVKNISDTIKKVLNT